MMEMARSREAELQCFAEQLATAFAAERETHDETKKQLDKEKKKRLALQQTLESMQVDWSTKKQSWHLSHKKHLRLREKYNKLLKIVREAAARRCGGAPGGKSPATPASRGPTTPLALDFSTASTPAPPPTALTRSSFTAPSPAPMLTATPVQPRPQAASPSVPAPPMRAARDMTHAEERAATRAAAQPERPEACTPEAFWNMGFSDDDGGAADPFDMAPSEYRASRSAPPVKAKMRMTVAVESEPIDDYEGGRFGRSGTRNHGRGRHAAPPVTPTVAHLSLGF